MNNCADEAAGSTDGKNLGRQIEVDDPQTLVRPLPKPVPSLLLLGGHPLLVLYQKVALHVLSHRLVMPPTSAIPDLRLRPVKVLLLFCLFVCLFVCCLFVCLFVFLGSRSDSP
jgi:hypothetical protein